MQRDLGGLVDDGHARRRARRHQVARDLGLAVHGDVPANQRVEVDTVARALVRQLDAMVPQPPPRSRRCGPTPARASASTVTDFEDAAVTDAPQHVFAGAARCSRMTLSMPATVSSVPEQEPGRPRPDDRHARGARACRCPADPWRCLPIRFCVCAADYQLPVKLGEDLLGHVERRIRRRHAAIDRGLQQHFLDHPA